MPDEPKEKKTKRKDTYLKNNKELPIDVEVKWTPEQIEELRKCKEDIIYFAQNYFHIVHLDRGKELMQLYKPQIRAVEKIKNNRNTIICASRQVGKCLKLDTKIALFGGGWTTMKDIKKGDVVCDWYGNPTTVATVHDIKYNLKCFEIVFSNGERIVADEEHDWYTVENNTLGLVRNTGVIKERLESGNTHIIPILESERLEKYVEIISITEVPSVPVRCISVDNPHKIFLCGESKIPTRNTSVMTVVCLWYALFNRNFNIAILANKETMAKEILNRIKTAYKGLPVWLKSGVPEYTKESVVFSNESKIFASTTSADSIRGQAVNLLFLDEFAFVPPEIAEEFFASAVPTISSSKKSKIVIVSCVMDDTYLYSNKGIIQMKDLVESPKEIGAFNIKKYTLAGKDRNNSGNIIFNNGLAPTVKITSQSSELKCSLTHKLFSCKSGKYGWHTADELQVGDFVSVRYGMNMWGNSDDVSDFIPPNSKNIRNPFQPTKLTPDLCYILGLYISEGNAAKTINDKGNMTSGSLKITCGDDLCSHLDKLGINHYTVGKSGIEYYISSVQLITFMEYLGFDISRKDPRKIIPSRLMQMSKENIAALLQGIFDGDGCASKGKITIKISSKELIDQIRAILLNFGILTTYFEELNKPVPNGRVKVESIGYKLSVNSIHSKTFFNEIGFRFKRKQDKLKMLMGLYDGRKEINCSDTLPYIKPLFKHDYDRISNKLKHDSMTTWYHRKEERKISRSVMLAYKDEFGIEDPLLNEILQPDLRWEPIKTKIAWGDCKVYDVSMENKDDPLDIMDWNHSVIYNGYVGHQTPNGATGKYYDIFTKAQLGEGDPNWNGWAWEKMYWYELDDRDEQWKKDQLKMINHDMDKWNQEYELHFMNNGQTALNIDLIRRMKEKCVPAQLSLDNGEYMVWEEPQPNRIYSVGVDVAQGTGGDYSIAHILDITDPADIRQCAVFASNSSVVYVFAERLNQIIRSWGRPFLCIERDVGNGAALIDALVNVHYYDNIVSASKVNSSDGRYNDLIGIVPHQNSKLAGISNMRYYLETLESVHLRDIKTVTEFETFVAKNNRQWGALKGHHDDRIMALVWGLFLLEKEVAAKYLDILEADETGRVIRIADPNQDLANNLLLTEGSRKVAYAKLGGQPPPSLFQFGTMPSYRDSEMAGYMNSGFRFV